MTKTTAHFDALGNPIVIGKRYGWSRSDSGFTHVIIGNAENFTEKGVTFKIISGRRCLYDNDPEILNIGEDKWPSIKPKVNIKGFCVFPVQL